MLNELEEFKSYTEPVTYIAANKPPVCDNRVDSDWVVLPASNFDAYYDSGTFSRKYLPNNDEHLSAAPTLTRSRR